MPAQQPFGEIAGGGEIVRFC